jgi:hypothetical protein
MGNRIAAPRLLKLTPLDSHLAGVNKKFQKAQFSWVSKLISLFTELSMLVLHLLFNAYDMYAVLPWPLDA